MRDMHAGMMHSAMGLAESLEGFYLDRNGRDVGSKIMLTQLKVKMASQDFSVRTPCPLDTVASSCL